MPTFNHCTKIQLLQRLREEFRDAKGLRALKIGVYIGANFTNTELRAAFGLNATQTTALRTKLDAMTTRFNALKAEAGQ